MDHDWYSFWTHYWWLIFPLFWMLAASARIWTRHRESQRILDMIKSYTDQGKEPPATLTDLFRSPRGYRGNGYDGCGRYDEPYYTHRLWRRFFVFAFLCAVFAVMAFQHNIWGGDFHTYHFGMIIPAIVLGALAISSLAGLMFRPRLPSDYGSDRKPDQK